MRLALTALGYLGLVGYLIGPVLFVLGERHRRRAIAAERRAAEIEARLSRAYARLGGALERRLAVTASRLPPSVD